MSRLAGLARLAYGTLRWKTLRGGWLPSYLLQRSSARTSDPQGNGPIDVIVAIVDHFEPTRKNGEEAAAESVRQWCDAYRKIADQHRDADGRPPQHTWFYRFEYLNAGCIRALSDATFDGFGEVEFHLHHGFDTHESFTAKLEAGLTLGNDHGAMLTAEAEPARRFGYIAGNWALDNGARDPSKSGCNTELRALSEMGCFADFTFPAISSTAQPRKSNAIYYAVDDPGPKSYDRGVDVAVGRPPSGDLMIVQGPLRINWSQGRIEACALESYALPDAGRMDDWIRANIHVAGRPEWIFIKLHTHGMQSRAEFLGPCLDGLFAAMGTRWNRSPYRLHYVTAREMYNMIKAAEAGHSGDPGLFRNFAVPLPANRLIRCDRAWRLRSCRGDCLDIDFSAEAPTQVEFVSGQIRKVSGIFSGLSVTPGDRGTITLRVDGTVPPQVETHPSLEHAVEIQLASTERDRHAGVARQV